MTYTMFMAVVLLVIALVASVGAWIWAAVWLYEWLLPNRLWQRAAYMFVVVMMFAHLFYGWIQIVIALTEQTEPW